MQIARPRVIAETGPQLEHRFQRRTRQIGQGREAIEKALVIGDDRADLRLLQHDLGQPDAIRIARILPGQRVTSALALPVDQASGEGMFGHRVSGLLRALLSRFSTVNRAQAIIGGDMSQSPTEQTDEASGLVRLNMPGHVKEQTGRKHPILLNFSEEHRS